MLVTRVLDYTIDLSSSVGAESLLSLCTSTISSSFRIRSWRVKRELALAAAAAGLTEISGAVLAEFPVRRIMTQG